MRPLVILMLGLSTLLLATAGCERKIPTKELGNVVFELPKVPGAEEPPVFPQLEGVVDHEGREHEHGHAEPEE